MTVTLGAVLLLGLHVSPASVGTTSAWLQAGAESAPVIAGVDEPHRYRCSLFEPETESEDDSEVFGSARVAPLRLRQISAAATFVAAELRAIGRSVESSHAARAPPAAA